MEQPSAALRRKVGGMGAKFQGDSEEQLHHVVVSRITMALLKLRVRLLDAFGVRRGLLLASIFVLALLICAAGVFSLVVGYSRAGFTGRLRGDLAGRPGLAFERLLRTRGIAGAYMPPRIYFYGEDDFGGSLLGASSVLGVDLAACTDTPWYNRGT